MSTLDFLPATTYSPRSTERVHRWRLLNTIIEDDEESVRGSYLSMRQDRDTISQVTDWLSPLSEHFPTPRGNHFMSAPIPQSSASSGTESVSPSLSSAPWSRDSFITQNTDFDDLYEVSSDEGTKRTRIMEVQRNNRKSDRCRKSAANSETRNPRSALPLVVPDDPGHWGSPAFIKLASPVPPMPPSKVTMTPAVFSYLKSQDVLSSSAPPSLDGSLSSEQIAQISAPPTPNLGSIEAEGDHWGGGVQLQPAAMATLQALSLNDEVFQENTEPIIDFSTENARAREMEQRLSPLDTNIQHENSELSAGQQRSLESLTRLEIPSPGGFFSALSPNTRHTWHLVASNSEPAPPSSTTAEHFYKTPWSSAPVEKIIEVSEAMLHTQPTAKPTLHPIYAERPSLPHENSDHTITSLAVAQSPLEHIVADEMITKHPTGYIEKLNNMATANLERTGLWLAAQAPFIAELLNPTEAALLKRAMSTRSHEEEVCAPLLHKTVRFSETVQTPNGVASPLPSLTRQESAYYRAFQNMLTRSRYQDAFIHRLPRFEALQSQRVSFSNAHCAQLFGKYQLSVVPMSAQRRLSSNVARGDDNILEDPAKLRRDKESEALKQISPATWNIMAIKLLNNGRLIVAPIAKRLARLSSMGAKTNGKSRHRVRILDLGGQATCDWAWHCASEYPHTKVYTVTTKALRQLSNSNIRGPSNHRHIAVQHLTQLPFEDNQFDLISAREIYTVLREHVGNGIDEWDLCLKECMRVLKPGGYLDFRLLDSDIVNAGSLGLAKSVEFGFSLKTLGYDPQPTKKWLGRLKRAGFVSMKRAWLFLPMGGNITEKKAATTDFDSSEVRSDRLTQCIGSTGDAANVSGIVGAWAWEKWMVKCMVQTAGGGTGEGALDGVPSIIQEGRVCGAGWRTLSGWARKPLRNM